jgi:DNA repair exonuclease SbcCD nuclease subunit
VGEDYIRFLHISDTHFGVSYALKPKNLLRRAYGELFFQKVADVVQKAISKHQIDFIIHSGDFFNRSKPPPEVVDRAVKSLKPAIHKEIPIYILPGNHERSKLPLGLLPFSNENIHLFSKPQSYIYEKNGISIKLSGFPYIRKNVKKHFNSLIKKAWSQCVGQSTKSDYSILVIHQLIEGSYIENYTFRRGHNVVSFKPVPQKFNYIACGHVHRFQFLLNPQLKSIWSTNKFYSVQQNSKKHSLYFKGRSNLSSSISRGPLISYAGSLERVSLAERNEPKGYIIGELVATKRGIQSIGFEFHELPAIRMVYLIWDLNEGTMVEYVKKTLETIYEIHTDHKQSEKGIVAIFRIRIRGKGVYSKQDINYLKQEAIRCNIYLNFTYKA